MPVLLNAGTFYSVNQYQLSVLMMRGVLSAISSSHHIVGAVSALFRLTLIQCNAMQYKTIQHNATGGRDRVGVDGVLFAPGEHARQRRRGQVSQE